MNRPHPSILQSVTVVGTVLLTSTVSFLNPLSSRSSHAATLENSPKAVLDEAWQIVNRDYVDENFQDTDWQQVREELLGQEYSSREQAYAALRRALARLDDPYTRFLDPEAFEALNEQTSGELSGVGLRLERDEQQQNLSIVEPIPNSPASREGIEGGDRILAIDGDSTDFMGVDEASQRIRGEIGTPVTLTILRDQREFDVTLVRSRIELPAVHHSLSLEGDTRVGYIRLSEFSSHAHEQMYRAIEELKDQGVDAFVLDLRGNPGGLLNVSIQIARMWLNEGAIVSTVDRHGNVEAVEATRTALTDLPLAVLVDRNSASASEIVAGALQDNERATIIGTPTFGKALVQSVNSLSDGSGLAVTVARYFTPNGTDISEQGIFPDSRVEMTGDQQLLLSREGDRRGTLSDPVYSRAIDLFQRQIPVARGEGSTDAAAKVLRLKELEAAR
ncbi:S41 family peptidase [Sodalinema sp.]|uniref:S41 family peptidase n=1 Tax=Sodalinema sp. TaxID=3080550 RepID=UPI00120557E8|nr:MAG: PDZ domain-containing protein [Phormidium sp. SL48-SHIP]